MTITINDLKDFKSLIKDEFTVLNCQELIFNVIEGILKVENLSIFPNLKHLKIVRTSKLKNKFVIKSDSLESIGISRQTYFNYLEINCPNLTKFFVFNFQVNKLSKIIKNLPKLECFECNFVTDINTFDIFPNTMTEFDIRLESFENINDLVKFPNLKHFTWWLGEYDKKIKKFKTKDILNLIEHFESIDFFDTFELYALLIKCEDFENSDLSFYILDMLFSFKLAFSFKMQNKIYKHSLNDCFIDDQKYDRDEFLMIFKNLY